MKKRIFIVILLSTVCHQLLSQSYNHQWLLGSYNFFQDPKGRMLIDSNGYTLVNENRKMVFKGTEANISDANGNLLMSSNGVWIANANNDTMLNGSGLNPSVFTSNWAYSIPYNLINIILPYPSDTSKYVLFHKTLWGTISPAKSGFYKSVIDMNLDNGLGALIEKNDTLLSDTLSWGIGACKHANGRDWWIIVMRDYNPAAYTFLLTPKGIDTMFIQYMGFTANTFGNVSPIVFSQDGKRMVFCTPINQTPSGTVLIYDFDRCTGFFNNQRVFSVSPNEYLFGLAFSSSGKYAYACSSNYIYQINVDSALATVIATYDGFISPPGFSCCPTTFFGMYLAANGKIYITSGSGVQHIHEMNYPDSAGIACDVQQHAISLNYAQLRAIPNHPNYYLGRLIGSPCDTVWQGIQEQQHDFKFRIYPNPISNNNLNIGYLLPQNKAGVFQIIDITGKTIFNYNLPQWSNEQSLSLPDLSNGVYSCAITSGGYRVSKKLVVIK